MTHETQGFNNSWGQPEAPEVPQPVSRFREALNNPALQERARIFAQGVGTEAIKGALENTGAVKYDDEGNMRVRKLGAIKAALRPTHTLRKAAMGAAKGARNSAQDQAVGMARQKVGELYAGATTPSIEQPQVSAGWGAVEAPTSWGGGDQSAEATPVAPSWGVPAETNYGQPIAPSAELNGGWGWGETPLPAPTNLGGWDVPPQAR